MNTIKKAMIAAAMFAGINSVSAQTLPNVRYGIKYNTTTCRYDIYMKVISGSIAAGTMQAASTAQVSLVVTHGTVVGSTTFPLPNISNATIYANEPKLGLLSSGVVTRGTTATGWSNPNVAIQRGALSGSDVYSFVPNVSNAYYPSMNTGDSIVLFSLDISTSTCGSNIRLWNNNIVQGTAVTTGAVDPTSANFLGDDYNNGFGVGSASDYYNSNSATITPPKPSITAARVVNSTGIQLTSTVTPGSACQTISDFLWTGPMSFTSTQRNVTIFPYTANNFGTYAVSAADNLGCSSNLTLAAIPLPVTIAKFDVSAAKCNAVLSWATSSENNFDRFAVQYSADGRSYMTVAEVPSKKATTGSEYSYSYAQVSGKGYYRLKMIDMNGDFKYSETISVSTNCGSAKADISISPNPTSGMVTVRGIAAGTQVRIMDMTGKVVANEISTGNAFSVNLEAYANGVYNVLVAQDGSWEKVAQIVKN